jgi:outer membrane protein OmpA-like peptidoglycan-associated protein
LPRGRTRETIVRANGVQVITIRNRFGDIIQRSRVLPDGREVFLTYSPEYDVEEYVEWRDPALDLPPLVLNIPVREYILSVSLIDDREEEFEPEVVYYDFLEKPPVERVERTYTVREVKQSARVRDKVRRIDLDTLTFGFGNADIKEDQIEKLENVANAMLKLLKKNPGETFLIEGHTDAVGTDIANLNLSDKRAEAVASALTSAFDIPAENLTTQGYGERYLKVKTTKPNELNRRVAIRRITQLVAPVALK